LFAQPPDEHVERIIDQREGFLLFRGGIAGPEDQHAGVERPVELQGSGGQLRKAVPDRQGGDGLKLADAKRGGILLRRATVSEGAERCFEQ